MANQPTLRPQRQQLHPLEWFASTVASPDIRLVNAEREPQQARLASSVERLDIWLKTAPRQSRASATTVANPDTLPEIAWRQLSPRKVVLRAPATTVESQAIWLVTAQRLPEILTAPARDPPREYATIAESQDISQRTARRSFQPLRLQELETLVTSVESLVTGPEIARLQLHPRKAEPRALAISAGRPDTLPESVLRHKEEVIR